MLPNNFINVSTKRRYVERNPTDAVIAACIFIACRKSNVPRTFQEIGNLVKVSKKALADCFKIIQRQFELEPSQPGTPIPDGGVAGGAASATDLMARFCNHLGLPAFVQTAATNISTRISESGIVAGRSPLTVASACIYFTSYLMNHPKTPREISQIAGVTDVTLRQAYRYVL